MLFALQNVSMSWQRPRFYWFRLPSFLPRYNSDCQAQRQISYLFAIYLKFKCGDWTQCTQMSRSRLRCELSSILDEGLFITIPNGSHANLVLLPNWRCHTLQNKCRVPFCWAHLRQFLNESGNFFLLTRPILSGFFYVAFLTMRSTN